MNGSQTFLQLTRDTLEEHRQIHFYLDQISQSLENLRSGPTDVEPLRRLAAQLPEEAKVDVELETGGAYWFLVVRRPGNLEADAATPE